MSNLSKLKNIVEMRPTTGHMLVNVMKLATWRTKLSNRSSNSYEHFLSVERYQKCVNLVDLEKILDKYVFT